MELIVRGENGIKIKNSVVLFFVITLSIKTLSLCYLVVNK